MFTALALEQGWAITPTTPWGKTSLRLGRPDDVARRATFGPPGRSLPTSLDPGLGRSTRGVLQSGGQPSTGSNRCPGQSHWKTQEVPITRGKRTVMVKKQEAGVPDLC